MKKIAKRLVIGVLSLSAIVWLGGTGFLIWVASFPPEACQWPYRAYAIMWPLYYVLSEHAIQWTQNVAFNMCGF